MSAVRPFRAHEVYAAPCLKCGEEVESPTLPVPDLCLSCAAKKKREEEKATSIPATRVY